MEATVDASGRLVIPKSLREALGTRGSAVLQLSVKSRIRSTAITGMRGF